jgi:glycosyltransferase involved in cell wall biosynthesis
VITAHNVAEHLPETLTSVFAQSRPADEVIVCDDGSSDDVVGVLAPWGEAVRLVRRSHGGEGAAKNTALQAAGGDVVVNLDGDDTMHPRRLEAIAWVLRERPDIDILTSEFDQFGPAADATSWRLADRFPLVDQRTAILQWNFLPAPAIRRQPLLDIGGYAEDLRYGPDWECYVRLLLRGATAAMLTDPLYRYRRWRGQQTADRRRVLAGRVQVLESIRRIDGLRTNERETIDEGLARARLELCRWELYNGHVSRADAARLARSATLPRRGRAWAAGVAVAPSLVRLVDRGRSHRPG